MRKGVLRKGEMLVTGMRTVLWRKEHWPHRFLLCFQEVAGMCMSLTCSRERGDGRVWSSYRAGWKTTKELKLSC